MNSPDWKDLERIWQSSAAAAPALEIIAKQHRRRWMARFVLYCEIVIVIATVPLSIWIMMSGRPFGPIAGGGTLLLTILTAALSFGARLPRRAAPDDSVASALDAAIHRSRVDVRWYFAGYWVVAACLAFYAVMAFLWAAAPDLSVEKLRGLLVVLGAAMVWMAAWQLMGNVYYLKRARELARLEEIKRSLAGE
jgi:hypothetical protein